MADVHLSIAGRTYLVTCKDGEESHLLRLGDAVDAKAKEAGGSAGGLNESRLLLFTALLMADEMHELKSAKPVASTPIASSEPLQSLNDSDSEQIVATLERLADRIEKLVAGLE